MPALLSGCATPSRPERATLRRVRPGDPAWPLPAQWDALNRAVDRRLVAVRAPLSACGAASPAGACAALWRTLHNPYAIGDDVALTQTSGWVDAWTSAPSVYAVAARDARDVAAAIDFARTHALRLVVKGGGHSYQGTSCAPDSLLVWTRAMRGVVVHDAFVPAGCAVAPAPAVSVDAGALWMHVYAAVAARAGRYVQGGGCATVGVAGLVQSGGFGSFSKRYGSAAGGLLEAEVVTADGRVRTVNACNDPDLFWALKGGGGGTFGVVTRVTLRTHALPGFFGGVYGTLAARSEAAYRSLAHRFVAFYRERLLDAAWGESVSFDDDNVLRISMAFAGLTQPQAAAAWQPFFDMIAASPRDYAWTSAPAVVALPARQLWDPERLRGVPGLVIADDRPDAPRDNVFWAGNQGEAGQFLNGYASTWLPAALLEDDAQARLADGLFEASRRWRVSLHFNKGLAGAPAEARAAAADTATHPAMLDAFALAIIAGEQAPAFAGLAGHEPDLATGRREAAGIRSASESLRRLVDAPASYVSESDYFERDWQAAFWGSHYARLRAIKARYDPDGLFFVHHGVGSEDWSPDGFERRT